MPEYLSPGVYVEEVPSAVKPIAGVSTSTAGFIGIFSDTISIPPFGAVKNEAIGNGAEVGTADKKAPKTSFDLVNYPVVTDPETFEIRVGAVSVQKTRARLINDDANKVSRVVFDLSAAPAKDAAITGDYISIVSPVLNEKIGKGKEKSAGVMETDFALANYPVLTDPSSFEIRVKGVPVDKSNVELKNDTANKESRVVFKDAAAPAKDDGITGNYVRGGDPSKPGPLQPAFKPLADGQVKLCTNFTEYKKAFGDFSIDSNQSNLTHAVYGFFNNGGTRCYVVRVKQATNSVNADAESLKKALDAFERVDDIAIVVAPGITDDTVRDAVVAHCRRTGNRFGIFDAPLTPAEGKLESLTAIKAARGDMPKVTDYAAWYFPWIKVADPIAQYVPGSPDGRVAVPPSGHIAGVYARVDTERGVHKAPANEPILGALDVTRPLSKAEQDGLNPFGVNCIRVLNNNILVWGARTIGGNSNADLKYVNVRRTLLFLRESIDRGTQWVVFEPNTPALWQKITRNASAFLTNAWRGGALFGNTPQEAFYVKCDAETNPPEVRDRGEVVTEIGVAIVRPAEFVIFRLSQWAGPGA
jgi:phage tail sheath protein FI